MRHSVRPAFGQRETLFLLGRHLGRTLDNCKNAFLISATLVCDGRPITLYSQTHPLEAKEKLDVHHHFLETLKALLPENCHPIIVADAGFQVPWHELVLSLGWDYVGRVRKPTYCRLNYDDGDRA